MGASSIQASVLRMVLGISQYTVPGSKRPTGTVHAGRPVPQPVSRFSSSLYMEGMCLIRKESITENIRYLRLGPGNHWIHLQPAGVHPAVLTELLELERFSPHKNDSRRH